MPAFATLSTRKRRMLAQMGIDVWIRRAAPAPGNSVVDAEREMAAAPAAPQPAIAVSPNTEPVEALELECFAAPGAVVVGAFGSAADRRLAQDVLRAVAGTGAVTGTAGAVAGAEGGSTGAVVRTQFRWPQTQTADRSPSAARSALGGFLRGQTERSGARCLLLFGSAAADLLGPAFSLAGCSVLEVPDAAQLRSDPARKKALWLAISHLAQR